MLDIDAEKRSFHAFAVEMAARSSFAQKVWQPLEKACVDFQMDYIDPSAHLLAEGYSSPTARNLPQ
jgi:hypothetical protein